MDKIVRELRYNNDSENAHKFWRVWVVYNPSGNNYTVTTEWGRIGTKGQQKLRAKGSWGSAARLQDKLIRDKLKKGYTELGIVKESNKPLADLPIPGQIYTTKVDRDKKKTDFKTKKKEVKPKVKDDRTAEEKWTNFFNDSEFDF